MQDPCHLWVQPQVSVTLLIAVTKLLTDRSSFREGGLIPAQV